MRKDGVGERQVEPSRWKDRRRHLFESDYLTGNACVPADPDSEVCFICTVDVRGRNVSEEHAGKPSPPATKVEHVTLLTKAEAVLLPTFGHECVEEPRTIDGILIGLTNESALQLGGREPGHRKLAPPLSRVEEGLLPRTVVQASVTLIVRHLVVRASISTVVPPLDKPAHSCSTFLVWPLRVLKPQMSGITMADLAIKKSSDKSYLAPV
jgi:hypothetical protein